MNNRNRYRTIGWFVIGLFVVLCLRLFHIQIIDRSYRDAAANNVLRYEVQYPPRGEIYDRNGEFLAQSVPSYDLMVVPKNLPKEGFDTVALAKIAGVTTEALDKACFILAGIDEASLLQAVETAVSMTEEGDHGIPVPDYVEEKVSTKVVKIIQSYTGVVNKMVWRKF